MDEKIKRQESLAPYLRYLDSVKLISDPKDLRLSTFDDLFKNTTLICLHNSFFEIQKSETSPSKYKIEKLTQEKKIKLVIFGGGIESISLVEDNILYLPVSKFYKNLEYFYKDQFLKSKLDLNILAFGENMKKEQILAIRARLSYIVNDLKENDPVTITDSRTLGDLKKYGEIVGDLSLYYSATKGEKITREMYLLMLENQVQKILHEPNSSNRG